MSKRRRSTESTVSIPDEATRQRSEIGDTVITLYGPSKIGKSTLASYFPDSIFIFTEPGGKFLKVRAIQFDDQPVVKTWAAFQAALISIEKSIRKSKFKTVIIDTVDRLYQLCFDAVCEDLGIEHPGEMAHGKAWNKVRLEWDEWITRLCNAGAGIVFISHSNERTYSNPIDGDETKTSFSLPKTGYEIINALSDFIFFYYYIKVKVRDDAGRKKTKRVRALYCKPTADIDAGDRTGLFPAHIRMPDGKEAFDALQSTFDDVQKQMRKIAKKG